LTDTSVELDTSDTPELRHKTPHSSSVGRGGGNEHIAPDLIKRALSIFYVRHHSIEFCSFLHVPSLEIESLHRGSRLFLQALIALSALYFSNEEAVKQGFLSSTALSEQYAAAAREHSRQTVDSPSSMPTFYCAAW
jgi:hypothetical protein